VNAPVRRQGLPDWLVVARRELLERVRTVWFVVVTLLGPVGMVAMIVLPALLGGSDKDVRMQVVDHTGRVTAPVAAKLALAGWRIEDVPVDTPVATLLARVEAEEIDGFLTVPADAIDALDGSAIVYQGDNATNQGVARLIEMTVASAVHDARANDARLTDDQKRRLQADVEFEARHTTGGDAGASGGATFFLGFVVAFIVYMAIVLYAVNVMRSVVQEKTNRIMEIMVAAAKPRALMLGKIIGVGGVGLLQLVVWLGIAAATLEYRMELLGALGSSGGGIVLPALSFGQVAVIIVYFVLGYFFYAALYAAIGAMVNSDQEAQQAQTPVVLFLIVPLTCLNVIAGDPRGSTAEILTMIPFFSPVLMPMRYLLGGAALPQLLLSIGLLAASTVLAAFAAARIYRVGILMYGKRPSLRELGRWLRSG
jgi:ABC-2 type transport system permease protein